MKFTRRTYIKAIDYLVVSLMGTGQVIYIHHPVYHKKVKLLKAIRARQVRESKAR